MDQPTVVQKAPMPIEIEAGKTVWWCACGKSAKQPFCDGSHKGSTFAPKSFTATETKTYYLCACKHTAGQPLCDGTHRTL